MLSLQNFQSQKGVHASQINHIHLRFEPVLQLPLPGKQKIKGHGPLGYYRHIVVRTFMALPLYLGAKGVHGPHAPFRRQHSYHRLPPAVTHGSYSPRFCEKAQAPKANTTRRPSMRQGRVRSKRKAWG